MGMGKFVIAAQQSWVVVCKDCQERESFASVDRAQDWIFGHDKDCTGTHR